jgi:hypothetical protein
LEDRVSKFCPNGHQLEDSWDICPYCQKTIYVGASPTIAKTRIETEAGSASIGGQSIGGGRKTVLLSGKPKAPVVGWLVVMNGEQKGEDFRVREGQNILGTSPDADIVVKDDTVTDRHASIRCKDGKCIISDLDSNNGTYLNDGKEAIAREDLKDNDVIRIGEVTLKFKCL